MVARRHVAIAGTVTAAVALLGAALAGARASSDAPRVGTDPPSPAEIAPARQVAQAAPPFRSRRLVVLLVERHEEAKSDARRRADVDAYDYADDSLTHAVVDLRTQRVDVVERA